MNTIKQRQKTNWANFIKELFSKRLQPDKMEVKKRIVIIPNRLN